MWSVISKIIDKLAQKCNHQRKSRILTELREWYECWVMAGILKFWYGINEKSEFMAGTCMGLEILSLKPTYFFLYLTQKIQYFFFEIYVNNEWCGQTTESVQKKISVCFVVQMSERIYNRPVNIRFGEKPTYRLTTISLYLITLQTPFIMFIWVSTATKLSWGVIWWYKFIANPVSSDYSTGSGQNCCYYVRWYS